MRNPANYNESVNVRKHFFFGERFQGILQVDYFNVLNRTSSRILTSILVTARSGKSRLKVETTRWDPTTDKDKSASD